MTHVYASPILRSRHGSTHGYDVTDPTRLNPELGSEGDFQFFQEELRRRGMGLLLDIVPNHMAASSDNAWWMDVLEHGPESAYASYFDIDWHAPSRSLEGRILLPFLGRPFAEVLEDRELALAFADGKFFVQYFEWVFPVAPRSYRRILEHRLDALKNRLGEESAAYQEYAGIAAAAATLSERDIAAAVTAAAIGEKRLHSSSSPTVCANLPRATLTCTHLSPKISKISLEFAAIRGVSPCWSGYLLSNFTFWPYWQNLNQEINYRRFFTITDLVGMRVEDPLVFEATHSLVLRMVEQNTVSALRIDHIDGLRDPLSYLNRLNEHVTAPPESSPQADIPVYVEKILARTERLRADWPVAGTTGYDFLNAVNSLFVYPGGAQVLERIYLDFLDLNIDYNDLLYQKKKLAMGTLFAAELRSLGHQLALLANQDRYARDVPLIELTQALNEVTACLSVYRTYIRNVEVSAEDRAGSNKPSRKPRACALNSILWPSLSSATYSYCKIGNIFSPTSAKPGSPL